MEKKEIKLIGCVDFKDIKIDVYNDPYTDKDSIICVWEMRDSDTCYKYITHMNKETGKITGYEKIDTYMNNETGKILYLNNAVIRGQTDKDGEMIPKFIITGYEKIDINFISFLLPKLEENYKAKNGL